MTTHSFTTLTFQRLILVCVLCMFISACGEVGDPLNTETPMQNSPFQSYVGPEPDADHNPPLEDGSEFDHRVPTPVSNDLLQREYPDTVVLQGSTDQNQIALTFDDGPDTRYTPQILDILSEHDVSATFFIMGARAEAHPEIVERMHEEGHVIANHSYWHPNLAEEDVPRLDWEVNETQQAIEDIVGQRPRLFRAPYGALNEELVEHLADDDYTVVGWGVDSLDWRQLAAEEVRNNVLSNVHPGSIVLMHDGGNWDQDMSGLIEALPDIITQLEEDGMELVTIPEMMDIPATF